MSAPLPSFRRTALAIVALAGAARAGAQQAASSPFMPVQQAGAAGAPTPGAPLEFRGVMEDGDGVKFRIVDPAKKSGAWVKLNEREPSLDFVVKQHEGSGDSDTVVVEQAGRSFTLPLRTAKVVSSGAAGQGFVPPPPQPMMPNMPNAVTQSVVVNPTPADEQRRLEAVAAEVARRRALREQASQQINQGVPVAPPVIRQQPQPVNNGRGMRGAQPQGGRRN